MKKTGTQLKQAVLDEFDVPIISARKGRGGFSDLMFLTIPYQLEDGIPYQEIEKFLVKEGYAKSHEEFGFTAYVCWSYL